MLGGSKAMAMQDFRMLRRAFLGGMGMTAIGAMTTRSPFFNVVCWMGICGELKRSPLWIWKATENGAEASRDGRAQLRDRRRERDQKDG